MYEDLDKEDLDNLVNRFLSLIFISTASVLLNMVIMIYYTIKVVISNH